MPLPGVHELKYVKIDTATTGDNTLVSAVTDKRIVVVGYAFVADAAVDVKFKGGSTDVTGPFGAAAGGGVSYAGSVDSPAFETADGVALIVNLSGAVQVSGHVTYVVV